MWEHAAEVAGPVELLRSQPGWWPALGACLPQAQDLQQALQQQQAEGQEAAAWRLAGHAAVVRIFLVEAFSGPRAAGGAGEQASGGW